MMTINNEIHISISYSLKPEVDLSHDSHADYLLVGICESWFLEFLQLLDKLIESKP